MDDEQINNKLEPDTSNSQDDIESNDESVSSISVNAKEFDFHHGEQNEHQALFKDELDLRGKIEAILFASPNRLKASEISDILQDESVSIQNIVEIAEGLIRFYNEKGSGFHLVHEKGKGYQFQTVTSASYLMERLFSQRPRPLSRAAHETLAIVAYRQPVSRADVEFIRGVDSGSIIKNLIDRDLIKCTGRKEDTPGKPMIFGTTIEFLKTYRLSSLKQLPPLESFQPSPAILDKAIESLDHPEGVDVEELLKSNEKSDKVSDELSPSE